MFLWFSSIPHKFPESFPASSLHHPQTRNYPIIVLKDPCLNHPIIIYFYFFYSVMRHRKTFLGFVLCLMFFGLFYMYEGPHQLYIGGVEKYVLWCGYWVGLGILSSVGLGTGLHTFLLYLVCRIFVIYLLYGKHKLPIKKIYIILALTSIKFTF